MYFEFMLNTYLHVQRFSILVANLLLFFSQKQLSAFTCLFVLFNNAIFFFFALPNKTLYILAYTTEVICIFFLLENVVILNFSKILSLYDSVWMLDFPHNISTCFWMFSDNWNIFVACHFDWTVVTGCHSHVSCKYISYISSEMWSGVYNLRLHRYSWEFEGKKRQFFCGEGWGKDSFSVRKKNM